jgi:D-alanyl-D-alanine carboxypeptidase
MLNNNVKMLSLPVIKKIINKIKKIRRLFLKMFNGSIIFIFRENTHQLLQEKSDIYVGIKTGVTITAGPCLASCVYTPCKRKFILIVLGSKNMKYRFKDT